jgi:hypothetical protein
MTDLVWAALGLLGMFLSAALGDLVSEEIRGWLDLAPRGVLRLAAARLDPELRESIYEDEWVPELHHVLHGAESRPITRLIIGTKFASGLLLTAPRIARYRATTTATAAITATAATDRGWSITVSAGLDDGTRMVVAVPLSASDAMIQRFLAEPNLHPQLVQRLTEAWPTCGAPRPVDIKIISVHRR